MMNFVERRAFRKLTQSLDAEYEQQQEKARMLAFTGESRPLPEGLEQKGLPLGHIALQGGFDKANLNDVDRSDYC